MKAADRQPDTIRHHAPNAHGSVQARTLFARVLLATSRPKWRLLPGLHGVRDRLPIRLEDHAPWEEDSGTNGGNQGPSPVGSKGTHILDAPGAAPACENCDSIPRQESQCLA